jgi:hypothetical protein
MILAPLKCTITTICLHLTVNPLWFMITSTHQAKSFPMKNNCMRPCRRSQRGIAEQLLRLSDITPALLQAVASTMALKAVSTSTSRSNILTVNMLSASLPNNNHHPSLVMSRSSHNKTNCLLHFRAHY